MSFFQGVGFFRLSGVIFSLGLTLLSLILPPWLMQSKESFSYPYFIGLHSFSFGALLGIGLVGIPFESSNDLDVDTRVVWILSSAGFIACLLMENSATIKFNSSTGALSSLSSSSIEMTSNNQIEMVDDDTEIETFQQRNKDNDTKYAELPESVKEEYKRLNLVAMSNMLRVISLYNVCHGIKLGSIVDYTENYGTILRFLTQKVMISLAFSSYITERDFEIIGYLISTLLFYCASAPVGILIGSCTQYWSSAGGSQLSSSYLFRLSNVIQIYSFTIAGYMAAVAAGLCIYIATCHLLPSKFAVHRRTAAEFDKVYDIASFILGYIAAIIICMIDQYI